MIYVNIFFSLYCGWTAMNTKERGFLLWIAAVIVFGSGVVTFVDKIKVHYEEQPAVKEVRI